MNKYICVAYIVINATNRNKLTPLILIRDACILYIYTKLQFIKREGR